MLKILKCARVLIVLACVVTVSETLAITPLKHFAKCYRALTDLTLTATHPLVASVQQGSLQPVDACMQIFNKALLSADGTTTAEYTHQSALDIKEARAVLQKFYGFHTLWQSNTDFTAALNNRFINGESDLYDRNQLANDLTWLLFKSGSQYQDLIRGQRNVKAIRELGAPTAGRFTGRSPADFWNDWSANYPNFASFNPTLVQVGELKGFRLLSSSEEDVKIQADYPMRPANDLHNQNYIYSIEAPYRKNFGGGILGTQSYLLLNLGFGLNRQVSDGGNAMARRMSKAVMHDLMCRDLPVASVSITNPYRRPASNLPFRKSTACTQCHASIDGMAGAFRSFAVISSTSMANFGAYHLHDSFLIAGLPVRSINADHVVTDPTAYLPAESDIFGSDYDGDNSGPQFQYRPPNGRLIFTTYTGSDLDVPVLGIEDLGTKLSNLDDYYICAAKRYFEFFTNYNDIDLVSEPSTDNGRAYKNAVIQWGRNLKSTQDLRNLVREIISSTYFKEGTSQ